jgi:hypothetical protein
MISHTVWINCKLFYLQSLVLEIHYCLFLPRVIACGYDEVIDVNRIDGHLFWLTAEGCGVAVPR